jgi:predicted small secreted protein
MRRTRYAIGATIFLSTLLALSCNNSYGIFKDVQGQTKESGSDVFSKTSVSSILYFPSNSNYYAATAKLYTRNVTASSWSKVSVGGTSSYIVKSVVVAGTSMYVLVGDASSNVALYSTTDGSAWTQIPIPSWLNTSDSNSETYLDGLFSANGQLFVVSHYFYGFKSNPNSGSSTYTLYYYSGGSFTPVNDFQGLTVTIRGVVYNSATSQYWFAAEDRVYYSLDAINSSGSTWLGSPPHTVWAISYTNLSASHVYISTYSGYLYCDTFSNGDSVSGDEPLTCVQEVPNGSGPILVVGTEASDISTLAEGYYEGTFGSLLIGNDNSIVASSSSIYNSTVEGFPVHCFYYDSARQDLFICISPGTTSSSYYGLYKSHYNGSSWNGWEAE